MNPQWLWTCRLIPMFRWEILTPCSGVYLREDFSICVQTLYVTLTNAELNILLQKEDES